MEYKTMKKLLLTMTAVGALAVAAPASAQYVNTNAYGSAGISNQISNLETRLRADIQARRLTRTEAVELQRDLTQLRRLHYQYSRNGLTRDEQANLHNRIRNFRQQLRVTSNTRYNRDGNNYYGRGGPYEDQYVDSRRVDCDDDGLLDSIVDIFDGNNDDCELRELRVGQRVTTGLYGIPVQYRARFRDGGGVYYRSDGRNIYQIDARTQTVIRVYDID
jgi:hypothetical protein